MTGRLKALAADRPLSVLVVDDDELERTLIADRLAHRGIQVGEARDGAEALERLRKEKSRWWSWTGTCRSWTASNSPRNSAPNWPAIPT